MIMVPLVYVWACVLYIGGCVPGGTKCVPCDPGLARYGANCVWSTDWHPSSTILSQGNPVKTASGPLPKTLPLPTAANGKGLLQGLETKGLIPLNTTKIFLSCALVMQAPHANKKGRYPSEYNWALWMKSLKV
jgi:hypothetical protein